MSKYIDTEKIPFVTGSTPNDPLDYVRRYAIDNMPAADVAEVKHGRWIDFHCSVCGKVWWSDEDDYCPNCGADMRGEQNDQ